MNDKTKASAMADAKALISTLELPYLRELQQILAVEIKSRDARAKTDAIAEIQKIAASVGMSIQDLIRSAPAKPTRQGKPAEIKFKHPENADLHWSGRGRQPHWVLDWEAKHGNLDALKVAA